MRLIDADAEISKIEQEIKRIEKRIKEWENNKEDRSGYHNVDAKIQQLRRSISDARSEIKSLERYSTAYDVDKVVGQLERNKFIEQEIILSDVHQGYNAGLAKAVEIVKAGGVNE